MESIFGINYENNLIKEKMIKMRKEIILKNKNYKKYLLNKYYHLKIKPKNIESLLEKIKQRYLIKRNNLSISLYPSFTEREKKLNKLKQKLLNISSINCNSKKEKPLVNPNLYFPKNKSFNNININKLNNLILIPKENKEKIKKGFLKRIKFTNNFRHIIKEKLNKSENDRNSNQNIIKKHEFNISKINKINPHFENFIHKRLKYSLYKESELFNKKLNIIKKFKINENMSIKKYQRKLIMSVSDQLSKESFDKLTAKLDNINKENNSVKAENNKEFIYKINKREQKILKDFHKKMKNFKLLY